MSRKKRLLANYRGDLYHRHYCRVCDTRVFPYDSLEALTVAPQPGAKGGPVLLYSANSRRASQKPEDISRTAWCWRCGNFVETYRETKYDTMVRYLRRRGVAVRFAGKTITNPDGQRELIEALEERLEDRRVGGGTLTLK